MQENRNQANKEDLEKSQLKPTSLDRKRKLNPFEVIWILLWLVLLGVLIWNQKQLGVLEKGLAEHQEVVALLKKDLEEIQSKVQSQSKNISMARSLKQPYDIVYLIHLAQQHLVLQKDRDQALKALYMAKVQAAHLKKGEALRSAIEQDIQILESINLPKQEEVIDSLLQLAQETQKLVLASPISMPEPIYPASESTHLNGWEKFKQILLKLMKKVVIVRHEAKDTMNSFIPSHTYLTGQLQLLFLRAQWAVFLKQQDAYRSSLEQAVKLIQQHYTQNKKTKEVLDRVNSLKTLSIDPVLPDLSHLLNFPITESVSTPACMKQGVLPS